MSGNNIVFTGNGNTMPLGKMIDEKVVVNGIVAAGWPRRPTNPQLCIVCNGYAAGILLIKSTGMTSRICSSGSVDGASVPRTVRRITFRAAGGVPAADA